jgi:hypothetical protein
VILPSSRKGVGFAHPALKRGANNHCAYDAGEEPLPAWSDSV